MSTLYITEFSGIQQDLRGHNPQIAVMPPVTEQTVAIGAASAQSSAFNNLTTMVRIESDVTCSVLFGSDPTATAVKMRIAADSPEYFMVKTGHKVAVISNT